MDFPDPEELIANKFNRDIEAIAREIGVDSVRYLVGRRTCRSGERVERIGPGLLHRLLYRQLSRSGRI